MGFDLRMMVAGMMIASLAYAARAQDAASEPKTTATATAAETRKAPDFDLKDETGKEHKLSDYKGKPVVLFWTNPGKVAGGDLERGCPFIMPRIKAGSFEKLASKVAAEGGVLLAVNSIRNNTPEDSKSVREKFNQTYPTLQDSDGKVGKAYGAKTTPDAFVISPEGNIVYDGALNDNATPDAEKDEQAKDYVLAAVTAARSGQAPQVTRTRSYGCGIKYKE